MDPTLSEWLNLCLRWFHIFAGILWIGSTYYFTWLDGRLRDEGQSNERPRKEGESSSHDARRSGRLRDTSNCPPKSTLVQGSPARRSIVAGAEARSECRWRLAPLHDARPARALKKAKPLSTSSSFRQSPFTNKRHVCEAAIAFRNLNPAVSGLLRCRVRKATSNGQ